MKLLLDLGNSRCKYAVLDDRGATEYGDKSYAPFGKLYSVKSLCDKFNNASKIIICSVLSKNTNMQIQEALIEKDKRNVFFLSPDKDCFGVKLAYDDLDTMGVDRIAALISAKENYTGNCCIIDCGTAITIDVLSADGEHQGGVILPGMGAMQKTLLDSTNIQSSNKEVKFNIYSNNTEEAIYSGSVGAVVGGIEYLVNKVTSDYDSFENIILTGGDAEFVRSYLSVDVEVNSTLVLDGLKVVAQSI